jgi:predicted nucleic acid-binding protein
MKYLDTNVFVRLLARDNSAMTAQAEALFGRIESGAETVFVFDTIVAETIFVLTSAVLYAQSRETVGDGLQALLSLDGVRMEDKRRCLLALELFAERRGLSFVDCLLAAAALGDETGQVVTFDRRIGRVPGVDVVEP